MTEMTTGPGTAIRPVRDTRLPERWQVVQIWVTWALVLVFVVAFWYGAGWAAGALWSTIAGK